MDSLTMNHEEIAEIFVPELFWRHYRRRYVPTQRVALDVLVKPRMAYLGLWQSYLLPWPTA